MTSSNKLPRLRAEFTSDNLWGPLSAQLHRYELETPIVPGEIVSISHTVGCIHAARASLIVRIGGGHLRAPTEQLLEMVTAQAPHHLDDLRSGPDQYIAGVVSWLEEEQRAGYLERTYITATIIVAVSDFEVWTWLVSPHGLVHGRPSGVVFGSTDFRYPVLRRLGFMGEPTFPGREESGQATSICCIGTPAGYERIRTPIGPGGLVAAFERGSLPFGPWPEHPITLETLWAMDAAWKHGLPGRGVVLGLAKASELALPGDWKVREVPLGIDVR